MAKYKKGDLELDEAVVGVKTPEDWAVQGFTLIPDTPAGATPEVPVVPPAEVPAAVPTPALVPPVEVAPTAPTAPAIPPVMGAVPFRADLPATADKQSIINLSQRPSSDWNETDIANWNYATGNTPIPPDATLTSSTGEKKKVVVGSEEASQLLSSGWALGDTFDKEAITSEALKDASEIDLSGVSQEDTTSIQTPEATVEASKITNKTIGDYLKEQEMPETETSKQEGDLSEDIMALMGETAGQAEMYEDEFKTAGGMQFKENLKNINNEIMIKTAALEKVLADLAMKPMTLSRMTGYEAQARRVAQADIMFLQASAQAVMNNLSFAQETAQAAVDAKYNPIIEELNIKMQQLQIIEGKANKEEAAYANALNAYYADQKTAIAEQKQNEADINSIIMNIIANNPNISKDRIIDQIKNASTPIEAMQIAGGLATGAGWQYVSSPQERLQLENTGQYEFIQQGGRSYSRLVGTGEDLDTQIVTAGGRSLLINKQTGETIKDLGGAYKTGTGAGTTLTGEPQDEWDYARSIIDANPNAGNEEMKTQLLENTKLNVSDINSLISERGVKREQADIFLTSEYIMKKAEGAFEAEFLEIEEAGKEGLSKYDFWGYQTKAQKEAVRQSDMDGYVADRMKYIMDNIKEMREVGKTDKEIEEELFET